MTLVEIAKKVEKFAFDNSPLLLTAAGAAGVITTAVLSVRGTLKAVQILEEKHQCILEDVPFEREDVKDVWQCYIPAAGTGLLTVGAVIGSAAIGNRRAAAMAAAFTVSERAFDEYKEKVAEKFGENKEQQVRDEVAQDRINKNPPTDGNVIVFASGNQICYDAWSGRYFMSDMETLKKAQNDFNYKVLRDGYASLTDFYDLIGLESVQESDEIGWSANGKEFELAFSTCLAPSGAPAISFEFRAVPIRDYFRFR